MTEAGWQDGDEISLLSVWRTLRRRWRMIAYWVVGVSVLAAALVFPKPALYSSSMSFTPEGAESGRSGLASLAGQFGVAIPGGNQSQSPDFYVKLLKSRAVLSQVARDSFVVPERGVGKHAVLDLLKVDAGPSPEREAKGVKMLADMIGVAANKSTGIVESMVSTQWPSVSYGIMSSLATAVNAFNQRTRQGQAAVERKFIEGRLTLTAAELRAAEDRLENFLRTNRQYGSFSELSFAKERLQRDVNVQQQVFTSLTNSLEDARIREVRDVPVITMVETPVLPVLPEPRGRARAVLVGAFLGALLGIVFVLVGEAVSGADGATAVTGYAAAPESALAEHRSRTAR
jgi:uncharacterized protein involved in exopolysaccharide biosynthesis